jgi:HPt (histidine-containing phosphotransfer) domain-containing protein
MAAADGPAPIYSTRAEEPEFVEAIDAFVVGLAERIDALQDAQCITDLSRLAELAASLARDAAALGYPPLGSGAIALENACRDGKAEDAHQALIDVTEIARRIRLGFRGAV